MLLFFLLSSQVEVDPCSRRERMHCRHVRLCWMPYFRRVASPKSVVCPVAVWVAVLLFIVVVFSFSLLLVFSFSCRLDLLLLLVPLFFFSILLLVVLCVFLLFSCRSYAPAYCVCLVRLLLFRES